jgi:hypothetical protein
VIRFVQRDAKATLFLPGLEPVAADFCGTYAPAYFDHWVSNVVSRTGFLQTLNDTLDFDIKVDFNAGVVAAGEAQIESTVTGNVGAAPASLEEQLISQSQVGDHTHYYGRRTRSPAPLMPVSVAHAWARAHPRAALLFPQSSS